VLLAEMSDVLSSLHQAVTLVDLKVQEASNRFVTPEVVGSDTNECFAG
jgi:hypothetical protein